MTKKMEFEVATIGERGQVVIPQIFREEMGIHKGDKFMVLTRGDMFVLKKLQAPCREDFDRMLKKSHDHAKKQGLRPSDVEDAIRRVRRR
ncbi:MAG TPA: AbrB/MazE/SpoVT family DNA-binding domain-containing protein [Candidatus Nanoarchaeia archaeon]|nr:AbrB/MazE/SpoVT family DNA-binding domain-containing protein [Candidatus Nanoarchaeia archaeon]